MSATANRLKRISPAQWRVLLHLYQHKLFTVRPHATAVRKSQGITDAELADLHARGLMNVLLGDTDIDEAWPRGIRDAGLTALLKSAFGKALRLRLSTAGMREVLDCPGNQIRYALGNGASTLADLFDDNEIELEDVAEQQRRRLITITLPEVGDFDLTESMDALTFRLGFLLNVKLTAKGEHYLPR